MYEHRHSSPGSGLVELSLLLILISAFVTVVTVIYVVRTFVKYSSHMSLWIALAVWIASCFLAGLVYSISRFDGSPALAGIGIVVLLITCLVVDLKNRDTLMRENVNLVDEVLRAPWQWGSEDKPLQETEQEQLAA